MESHTSPSQMMLQGGQLSQPGPFLQEGKFPAQSQALTRPPSLPPSNPRAPRTILPPSPSAPESQHPQWHLRFARFSNTAAAPYSPLAMLKHAWLNVPSKISKSSLAVFLSPTTSLFPAHTNCASVAAVLTLKSLSSFGASYGPFASLLQMAAASSKFSRR
jgi:hypothetical protein